MSDDLSIADYLANGTGFSLASFLRESGLDESERDEIAPIYAAILGLLQSKYGDRLVFEGNEWHVVPEINPSGMSDIEEDVVNQEIELDLPVEPEQEQEPEEEIETFDLVKKPAGKVSDYVRIIINSRDINRSGPIVLRVGSKKTSIPLNEKVIISKDIAALLKNCDIPYKTC